jgi:hypothetical protein
LLTTKSTPDEQTIEFYKKMKINSFGWRKVAAITNIQPTKGEFSQNLIAWITCIIFVYSLLLSAGKFIFHQWLYGIICLAIGIISGFMLFKCIRKMKFD